MSATDEMPATDGPDRELDELDEETRFRLEVLKAAAADPKRAERMRAAEAEAARMRATESDAETVWSSGIAAWVAAQERAVEAAAALPCFEAMRPDPPDVAAAVDACVAAGARDTCTRWKPAPPPPGQPQLSRPDPTCPQRLERGMRFDVARRLHAARIPGSLDNVGGNRLLQLLIDGWSGPTGATPSIAELLLADAAPMRDARGVRVRRPLRDLEPLQVVRAFLSRRPCSTFVGERMVTFRGDEWAVFLGGELGLGKTLAACVAALTCDSVAFAAAPELTERDPLVSPRRAKEVGLLILDDLGTERDAGTGYAVDTMVDVLTTRHRHRRLTICTTNLRGARKENAKPGEIFLVERYGERVFDRLREGAVLVGFRGSSHRGGA